MKDGELLIDETGYVILPGVHCDKKYDDVFKSHFKDIELTLDENLKVFSSKERPIKVRVTVQVLDKSPRAKSKKKA